MRIRTVVVFVFVTLCAGVLVVGVVFYRQMSYRTQHTSMSDRNSTSLVNGIRFEVASTTLTRVRGLSGRLVIPYNYAMLFVFTKSSRYGFWMKDMLAPIDIVWLSDIGRVVGMDISVSPNTYPHVFYPPQPVKYVLEMRANSARQEGLKVGTLVDLPTPYAKDFLH